MDKIDFVNSTQPALNDANLNLMQDNIERAINAQVSGDTLPIGTLLPFTSTTTPENWLLCDGRAVSRTTYSQLFNVIGTRYGTGDGSTTFNLPDLRGRVPVGYDSRQTEFNSTGKTGGEKAVTLTTAQIPSHSHTTSHFAVGSNAPGYNSWEENIQAGSGTTYKASAKTDFTGGGNEHNNLQPYLVTRYIIKAFQTAGTIASVVNARSTSTTNIYSADYINKNFESESIYCVLPSDVNFNESSYTQVSTWQKNTGTGSNLTISSGKIRIGNNINHVKITVKMYIDSDQDTVFYSYILKNGTNITGSWFVQPKKANEGMQGYNQAVAEVQAGDIITVNGYGNAKFTNNTSIIVEKLN